MCKCIAPWWRGRVGHQVIELDFVDARREDKKNMSVDDFHSLLVIARYGGPLPGSAPSPWKYPVWIVKMSINPYRFPQRCRHHLCLSNHLPAPYSLVFRTTEGSFCFTGCCLWATASQTWLRKRGTRQKSLRQNASCACADIWWQDHTLDFKLLQSIQKSLADANRERVRYIFRSLGSVQYLWNYY